MPERMGQRWACPPSPLQKRDSTTTPALADDDDIIVVYDSRIGPCPTPLYLDKAPTNIYGDFQAGLCERSSSTTAEEPEPALYEERERSCSTSADEHDPASYEDNGSCGDFEYWELMRSSSTSADEPDPALYKDNALCSDFENLRWDRSSSTSAAEPDPEVVIVYDSRLDERQSVEVSDHDEICDRLLGLYIFDEAPDAGRHRSYTV